MLRALRADVRITKIIRQNKNNIRFGRRLGLRHPESSERQRKKHQQELIVSWVSF